MFIPDIVKFCQIDSRVEIGAHADAQRKGFDQRISTQRLDTRTQQ
jgi:hypothetical protein